MKLKISIILNIVLFISLVLLSKQFFKVNNKYQGCLDLYNKDLISCSMSNNITLHNVYQVIKDVTELLDKYNITYWADGGTMLGAYRHEGVMRWDDDADLNLFEEDIEKLKTLVIPELEKLNYTVVLNDMNFFQVEQPPIKGFKFPGGHLDIFPVRKDGNSLYYADLKTREVYPIEQRYEALFPLKNYKFGPLLIKGPREAEEYLSNCFGKTPGKDWKNDVVIYNHSSPINKLIRVPLNDDLKRPGEILHPLENRVQK